MRTLVLLVSAFLVSACTLKVDSPNLKLDLPKLDLEGGKVSGELLACRVTLPGGSPVQPDTDVDLRVDVGAVNFHLNLKTPFHVSGTSGSFNTQVFTIRRQYSNSGTEPKAIDDEVVVVDAENRSIRCGFQVVVRPRGDENLACSLSLLPSAPKLGETFWIQATANGGSGSYAFSDLRLGGGTLVSGLTKLSDSQASASAKYTTSGSKTLSVQVTDSEDNTTRCERTVSIAAAPSVALTVSPSTSVSTSASLVVSATAAGFSSAPSFTFSTPEAGISFEPLSASSVRVRSADGKAHAFSVVATARAGAETASASVSLQFTTAPVTCTVEIKPSYEFWDGAYLGLALDAKAKVTGSSSARLFGAIFDPFRLGLLGEVNTLTWRFFHYYETPWGYWDLPLTIGLDVLDGSGTVISCTPGTLEFPVVWE